MHNQPPPNDNPPLAIKRLHDSLFDLIDAGSFLWWHLGGSNKTNSRNEPAWLNQMAWKIKDWRARARCSVVATLDTDDNEIAVVIRDSAKLLRPLRRLAPSVGIIRVPADFTNPLWNEVSNNLLPWRVLMGRAYGRMKEIRESHPILDQPILRQTENMSWPEHCQWMSDIEEWGLRSTQLHSKDEGAFISELDKIKKKYQEAKPPAAFVKAAIQRYRETCLKTIADASDHSPATNFQRKNIRSALGAFRADALQVHPFGDPPPVPSGDPATGFVDPFRADDYLAQLQRYCDTVEALPGGWAAAGGEALDGGSDSDTVSQAEVEVLFKEFRNINHAIIADIEGRFERGERVPQQLIRPLRSPAIANWIKERTGKQVDETKIKRCTHWKGYAKSIGIKRRVT